MAKISFSTICPCGAQLFSNLRTPTRYEHTIVKVVCKDCATRVMFTCKRDLDIKDRRVFDTFVDILELSEDAAFVQRSKISVKVESAAAALGIKPRPDKSMIKTEMD